MKKILIFIFAIILLTSFGSSLIASDLGTFKANNSVELYQNCENCTFVNISSVKLPNSTIFFFNENMIKNAQDYTFKFNTTPLTGGYFYNVCGDRDGTLECEDIKFFITKSGMEETTANSILHLIMIVFATLMFILSSYGFLQLPFRNQRDIEGTIVSINNLKYFKILLFMVSYSLLVWVFNLLHTISNNFNILGQYNKFFEVMFKILNGISFPLFVFVWIFAMFIVFNDLKFKKLITRGLSPQ